MTLQQIDEFASQIQMAGIKIPSNLSLVVTLSEEEWSHIGAPNDLLSHFCKLDYNSPFGVKFSLTVEKKSNDTLNVDRSVKLKS